MMKYRSILFVIAACVQLSGCTYLPYEAEDTTQTESSSEVLELPATFSGEIPCKDCLKVDIVINLRRDMLYQLRKTYQSEAGPVRVDSQMRNWRYSEEGNLIVLGKQKGMLKTYVVVNNNTLRFLELENGQEGGGISYELHRMPDFDRFTDDVKARGMFRLKNDRAVLEECSSGKSFPVARTGEYLKAVKEYMSVPHSFGEPVLISFDGSLSVGISEAGEPQEVFSIQRVKTLYPNQDCEGKPLRASLTGTLWRLSEIDGRTLDSFDIGKPPYLILESDNSMRCFSGCNNITGTYLARGELLLFERDILARFACFKGLELENLVIQALEQSESFDIREDMLHVKDQNGIVRAIFRAGS
jgi:copper homeostasis protein (lipoprotein)